MGLYQPAIESTPWLCLLKRGLALTTAMVALSPVVYGQEGNRDYYAPRLESNERELFKNVEQYHLEPGIADMRQGRYVNALEHFEFILGFYPNHPRVLVLISELCTKWVQKRCNAEQWFDRGILRNPAIARTYLVYGVHLQRRNRVSEAIESYKKALAIDPSLANAHYNLGLAYFAQKQYALANRHAQASYVLGTTLPGLKDKLSGVGQWQEIEPELLKQITGAPVEEGDTSKTTGPKAP